MIPIYLIIVPISNYMFSIVIIISQIAIPIFANIIAVDYDPGASEVNQLNRIKLMLATAQKNLKEQNKKVIS